MLCCAVSVDRINIDVHHVFPYVKMRVLLGYHVHAMQLLWCSIVIVWRDGLDSYRTERTLVPMQFFMKLNHASNTRWPVTRPDSSRLMLAEVLPHGRHIEATLDAK